MKSYDFLCENICRGGSCHHPPLEKHFQGRVTPFFTHRNDRYFQDQVMPSSTLKYAFLEVPRNRAQVWRHQPLKIHFQAKICCYSNATPFLASSYILARPQKNQGIAVAEPPKINWADCSNHHCQTTLIKRPHYTAVPRVKSRLKPC